MEGCQGLDGTFEQFARDFYNDFGRERHHVLNMMDLLFSMASCDGGLHPREEALLLRAAGVFHISRMQYDRIKSRYYRTQSTTQKQRWAPLDPHYAVLGAQPADSLDLIKKNTAPWPCSGILIKWLPKVLPRKRCAMQREISTDQ
ncbi:MAG: TerB family tellurite resistance protein [Lewinellaceae bacterium]|nr:TerB family tellurite resistance protein [Lewinellaceae bacterium]